MKPGGVARQIIGSFEDIGKSIAEETGKIPSQVVDTALESLGVSGNKQQSHQMVKFGEGKPADPNSSLGKLAKTSEEGEKRIIARAALKELSGIKNEREEPSVYEAKLQEDAEKEEQKRQSAILAAQSVLPKTGSHKKPGDLYGVSAKRAKTERKLAGAD